MCQEQKRKQPLPFSSSQNNRKTQIFVFDVKNVILKNTVGLGKSLLYANECSKCFLFIRYHPNSVKFWHTERWKLFNRLPLVLSWLDSLKVHLLSRTQPLSVMRQLCTDIAIDTTYFVHTGLQSCPFFTAILILFLQLKTQYSLELNKFPKKSEMLLEVCEVKTTQHSQYFLSLYWKELLKSNNQRIQNLTISRN